MRFNIFFVIFHVVRFPVSGVKCGSDYAIKRQDQSVNFRECIR